MRSTVQTQSFLFGKISNRLIDKTCRSPFENKDPFRTNSTFTRCFSRRKCFWSSNRKQWVKFVWNSQTHYKIASFIMSPVLVCRLRVFTESICISHHMGHILVESHLLSFKSSIFWLILLIVLFSIMSCCLFVCYFSVLCSIYFNQFPFKNWANSAYTSN